MMKKNGAVRADVYSFVAEQYGVEPEYVFADDDDTGVLRHPMSKKWFGIVMSVKKDRFGLSGEGTVDVLNVKLLPEMVGTHFTDVGFFPAYHMNKEKWISILLDGRVDKDKVFFFLDASYQTVTPKRKNKEKRLTNR